MKQSAWTVSNEDFDQTQESMNTDNNLINIFASVGTLRIVEPVDYESQKQYVLLVRAMDPVHWEMLYSEVNITVDILDVNDHAPRASGTSFVLSSINTLSVISRYLRWDDVRNSKS